MPALPALRTDALAVQDGSERHRTRDAYARRLSQAVFMSYSDPLLKFISQDASSDSPQVQESYKISVVVGGLRFTGHVVHPQPFLDEALPARELDESYRVERGGLNEAGEFLHLLVSGGTDWPPNTNRHVRFRMNGIDAWWAE
ncbi:hypothetical protein QF035_000083 [Streptomyces umbrinus]|uniref:Uncharacterized protein n=1 Tax=Streptomyces umbrinus TaxID=67370 RepID=A0ABU0SG34_9ACTN|nr:hypothetical protein [Streptomyces umbrinus]MDQ1022501.1 hypothetical protein [Streptomyces umbrinus]